MAKVYFHYSNSEGVCIDQRGTAVGNLTEVRDHAARVVQSLITAQGPEDWRDWTLHVSDDLNDEIFALPFSSMLGKLHWEIAMLAMQPLLRRVTEIVIHWHRLVDLARNPYRPELHYMRGPGPKWHAKHQAHNA